jgi:anti-sigma factor RsiW
MHEPVKAHIEEYLAGSDSLPRQFTAHLDVCLACRQELAELRMQSALLHVLRTPAELDPRPGFYARVIERIDTQRQSSIWSLFLEPAFGRRLAMASAVLAVLMGLYLVSSEPSGPYFAQRPTHTVILPGEDDVAPVLGAGPEQDRGAILVNLATYQE